MTIKLRFILQAITGLLALSIALPSNAQDAEPFDPYAAYKKAQTQDQSVSELPAPLEPEESGEIVLPPAPREGMSDQEIIEWMDGVEAQSKARALADQATSSTIQAPTEGTPLGLDDLERLVEESRKSEPQAKKMPDPMLEPRTETVSEPISEPLAQSEASSEVNTAPTQQQSQAQSLNQPRYETQRADIAPFYFTAQDYITHRGANIGPQMHLKYSVSGQDGGKTVEIILGSDYAMITQYSGGAAEKQIYDFAYNRLLTFTQNGDQTHMINTSLYAVIHRNVRTIRRTTEDGKKDIVQAGNAAMDAFWMESALSFSMNERLGALSTEEAGARSIIQYKDETALDLTFSDTPYPSPELSEVFLAYAHHGLPLHPSVLRQFFAAPNPPQVMDILVKGPNFPEGQRQIWTLESAKAHQGAFPINLGAISVIEGDAIDPVAFVISQAAQGIARGGKESPGDIAAALSAAEKEQDWLGAWLAAQRYLAQIGPCDKPVHDSYKYVCIRLDKIEARDDLPPELNTLIKAFDDAQTKTLRVAAVKALAPYADDKDAPAIIIKTLGLTRAKIRTATARAASIDAIDGQNLITQALARDPYDPGSYLGLAQIYAAKGQYEAAWDMYDAMRASLSRQPNQRYLIDTVEDRLRSGAPGYFIP